MPHELTCHKCKQEYVLGGRIYENGSFRDKPLEDFDDEERDYCAQCRSGIGDTPVRQTASDDDEA